MWETIGTGLMDFGKSSLGQTVIGAGLGYGADKLSGGKGGTGAVLGGLGGFGNSLTGAGANFGDSIVGQGVDYASTGLFGQGGETLTADQNAYNTQLASVNSDYMSNPAIRESLNQGYQNLPGAQASTGLLGGAKDWYSTNKDFVGGGIDVANAYGNYQTGQAERENSQSEIDYRNRIAQLEEDEYNYQVKARAATQAGADEGFANSSLSNYYTA